MSEQLTTDQENTVISLPSVTFRPTGVSTNLWAKPTVISDEEGQSYLIIPCQHMEISIGFGEDTEAMELIVKALQERIAEVKEMQA